MGIGQALGFVGATVVLVGMPGPNNIYISLRSLTQGRRAGVVSALAIETGSVVYIVLAAFGLAALVQASPVVFTAISLAGAAYLAVLGVQTLRSANAHDVRAVRVTSLGRIFRDGVLVNLLNPKAALFFLAFLPQFTSPGTMNLRNQMLLLGLGVLAIGLLLDLCYALGADVIGRRFRTAGRRRGVRKYVVAGIYLTIAVVAAASAFTEL
jgi:threonine/homoserine/homoserine lactone efflux protein